MQTPMQHSFENNYMLDKLNKFGFTLVHSIGVLKWLISITALVHESKLVLYLISVL